jgi:solute carrier family 44 (choline transporter-like protein), member 2/4/5
MIYHVFALLWINAFIIGSVQFIIGASTCLWYFTCKSDSEGKGTIGTSIKWLFKYHWASIALGSLIIAICQMIRLIFEYYRKKMGMLEKTSTLIKILVVSTGYCLWCLEKCVKYISKNAYIQIALTNDGFLQAAINAFTLILKNAHRFGFANTIGTVYMIFGCFFIAACTSFGTYAFMVNYDGLDVTSPIPTTCVMGVIAIMVGYQFLSIFSFSSDAILQSYLLDEELRRPASASRPDDMQAFYDSMSAKFSRCLCGCR